MIRFFRRIRKRLFQEGNIWSYTVYALGEIILVVAGILIAIQINNWNEELKDEKRQLELLNNLKSDLERDASRLNTIDHFLENRKNYAKTLLEYIESPPDKIDSVQVFLALERCGYVHTFKPPFATYNEMLGSGTLSLLSSKEIKSALASYKTFTETNSEIEERYASIYTDYSNISLRYMEPEFGYLGINDTIGEAYKGLEFDLTGMINDHEFVASIKEVYNKTITEQRFKQDLVRPRIARLVKMIEEELK